VRPNRLHLGPTAAIQGKGEPNVEGSQIRTKARIPMRSPAANSLCLRICAAAKAKCSVRNRGNKTGTDTTRGNSRYRVPGALRRVWPAITSQATLKRGFWGRIKWPNNRLGLPWGGGTRSAGRRGIRTRSTCPATNTRAKMLDGAKRVHSGLQVNKKALNGSVVERMFKGKTRRVLPGKGDSYYGK